MKIEKLTENKIRAVISDDDLIKNNIDFDSLMNKSTKSQDLFFKILEKAEKELNFYTDGYKLLIEAFTSVDGVIVFTITKFEPKFSQDSQFNSSKKKRVIVKKKTVDYASNQSIYSFPSFEEFCNFCSFINNIENFEIKKFSKDISLVLYTDTYYLVVKNINVNYKYNSIFHSVASEFGKIISTPRSFESKLCEYGEVIIKKNVIDIGIKYFC